MRSLKLSWLVVLSLFVSTSMFGLVECEKIKAAIDLGSGTTKLKVARVDTCKSKILEVLYESYLPVSYKDDLEQQLHSGHGVNFSESIQERGMSALQRLKNFAHPYKPVEYVAIATSAFREAKNSKAFIEKMNQKLGLNIKIVSQEQEAEYGFLSTAVAMDTKKEDLLVWDIGGASMQMISLKPESVTQFEVYKGNLASVSFKNKLIHAFRRNVQPQPFSPNPLSEDEIERAIEMARVYAERDVPEFVKTKLASSTVKVVGIGNVHYFAVQGVIDDEIHEYNQAELEKILNQFANLKDAQLGKKYADTLVSNLALVLGYMKALKIEHVFTPHINLLDALLIAE